MIPSDLSSYRPYSYRKLRDGWLWDSYGIYYEDTHVQTIEGFEDARQLTHLLNAAFMLGRSHELARHP